LEASSEVSLTSEGIDFGTLGVAIDYSGIDDFSVQAGCQTGTCSQTIRVESSKDDSSITLNLGTQNIGTVIFGNDEHGMNHIHGSIFITGASTASINGTSCIGNVIANNRNGYMYHLVLSTTSLKGLIGTTFDFYGICSLGMIMTKYDTLTIDSTPSGSLHVITAGYNTVIMNSIQANSTIIDVFGSSNVINGPRYSTVQLSDANSILIDSRSSTGSNVFDMQLNGQRSSSITIVGQTNDHLKLQVDGTNPSDTFVC
jgi:hypothetical protein